MFFYLVFFYLKSILYYLKYSRLFSKNKPISGAKYLKDPEKVIIRIAEILRWQSRGGENW